MKLLLDTHLLLWAALEPEHLSAAAQQWIADEGNELIFSSVSIWEVAIKEALRRRDFTAKARDVRRSLLDSGYAELALTAEHAETVSTLPPIHRDPFDRILIAQAISEGMTLLTADTRIAQYQGPIRKV